MSIPPFLPRRAGRAARCASGLALTVAVACTEPQRVQQATPMASRLDARLELSDSLAKVGDEVRVTVRLVGTKVASMTARLAYDTTGLHFIREEPIEDGATRVMNPLPGLVRFAAFTSNGFTNGELYAVRFTLRRAAALRSLRLVVDEVHTVAHADAMDALPPKSP